MRTILVRPRESKLKCLQNMALEKSFANLKDRGIKERGGSSLDSRGDVDKEHT